MRVRGPESQLDWLAVASLWLGAVLFAIKTADFPLLAGAPQFLASHFWNVLPAILLTMALAIFIFRQFNPLPAAETEPPSAAAPPSASTLELGSADPLGGRAAPSLAKRIEIGVRDARAAVADNNSNGNAERQARKLEALAITLQKEKGFPKMRRLSDPKMRFEANCRYLEVAQPYLEQGHDEEAKRAVKDFATRVNRVGRAPARPAA